MFVICKALCPHILDARLGLWVSRNKWSTFHTLTICWSLRETVASWSRADLYFVPMPARTALPPNANFGLCDRSYWSSGLIYVNGQGVFISNTVW